ncbi:aminotransferase class I/II-fold pyridoxal phosphate-dependent enzyme, partial [Candidatus Aerophobetes bacterium]|nr:aminotransferase class I/II-fold pyridoxal phosphate-dependent enzyme [Candidatus Aerophobetes bacterium]
EKIPSEIASRAKLIWINYPNNPTGASVNVEFFEEVVDFARKFNIIVCHDLAYSELSYDGYRAPSLLEVRGAKDIGIEFHSLSKTFCMTGWRIGFAVGNRHLISYLKEVKTNVDSGVFQAIQEAGIEALRRAEELVPSIREVYRKRRDFFVKGLREIGWDISLPRATFYLWIKVPAGYTSFEFAQMLLTKCGIVVTPGTGFGPSGEGYIRVALTVGQERLKEALERLKKALN